jgi:hypothetical protein
MASKRTAAKAATVQDETIAVPRVEIAKAHAQEAAEAIEILELVQRAEVKTPEDYQFAAGALKEVAQKHDQIKELRDRWVGPLKSVVKDIEGTFKPVLDAYKECERIWKSKIGQYQIAAEAKRRALLKEASTAFKKEEPLRAERLVEKATETEVPDVKGVGATIRWTGEVIDGDALIAAVIAGKLPRSYVVPNVAALLAVTEAAEADPQIPGWRAFQTADVRTSRKG